MKSVCLLASSWNHTGTITNHVTCKNILPGIKCRLSLVHSWERQLAQRSLSDENLPPVVCLAPIFANDIPERMMSLIQPIQTAKFRDSCRCYPLQRLGERKLTISTNRRRPHRAGASGRRPASPSGTARARPGRPGPREAQGRGQRRIPVTMSVYEV